MNRLPREMNKPFCLRTTYDVRLAIHNKLVDARGSLASLLLLLMLHVLDCVYLNCVSLMNAYQKCCCYMAKYCAAERISAAHRRERAKYSSIGEFCVCSAQRSRAQKCHAQSPHSTKYHIQVEILHIIHDLSELKCIQFTAHYYCHSRSLYVCICVFPSSFSHSFRANRCLFSPTLSLFLTLALALVLSHILHFAHNFIACIWFVHLAHTATHLAMVAFV